jgi:hypothetical protein
MVLEPDQPEVVDEHRADTENLVDRIFVFQHRGKSPCRHETERVSAVAAAVFSVTFPQLNETDVMSFEDTDKRMPKVRPAFLLSEE